MKVVTGEYFVQHQNMLLLTALSGVLLPPPVAHLHKALLWLDDRKRVLKQSRQRALPQLLASARALNSLGR